MTDPIIHTLFPRMWRLTTLILWLFAICSVVGFLRDPVAADEQDFPPLDRQPFSDRIQDKERERGGNPPPRENASPFPELPDVLRGESDGSSRIKSSPGINILDEEPPPRLDDRTTDMPPETDAENRRIPAASLPAGAATPGFDWKIQPVSVADVDTGRAWPFQNGTPNLNAEESAAYAELIRAALNRRGLIPAALPEDINTTTAWETAFYRYEDVRRQAWIHGNLSLQASSVAPVDPFSGTPGSVMSTIDSPLEGTELKDYSLPVDMQVHPGDFTGRPVVLYGLFTPSGAVEVQAVKTLENEERQYVLQRGTLKSLSGRETLAILDAISFVDPDDQLQPSTAWPVDPGIQIPVLVKGWFVKLWGQRPLIFTEVVRVLSPRPYDQYIREHVRTRRRISDDESWIYHETLRQLQVTSLTAQKAIALETQQLRVRRLLAEIQQKAIADRRSLEQDLKVGKLAAVDQGTREGFETRIRRLQRQLEVREARYSAYQQTPASFPVFVDLFQNPGEWQGKLVTLRGYARRVMTHAGDRTLFHGQPLHELWLFTEDSQHIPTVIVTPTLPRDFPVESDLIDSVTVTGCLMKMYVYRSQTEARLAPFILAGHVEWNPSAEHVLDLVKDGHITADSPLVAQARAADPRRVSDTLVLMIGVLTLIVAMTVWGRIQRDRRRRDRLLRLVQEKPDFRQAF